ERIAEEITDVPVPDLCLVPDRAVCRGAHIHAAVVAFLLVDLLEAPFDVKDAVGQFLVVEQHLVNPDPVADEMAGAGVYAPRVLASQRATRSNRHTLPVFQVLVGQQIFPAGGILLQGARTRFLLRGRHGSQAGQDGERQGRRAAQSHNHEVVLRSTGVCSTRESKTRTLFQLSRFSSTKRWCSGASW